MASIDIAKLENMSLLASMHNIQQRTKSLIGYQQESISRAIEIINGTPFKSLGFTYPKVVFKNMGNNI